MTRGQSWSAGEASSIGAFIDQYLLAMTAMGTRGYRKLFDLTHAAFEIQGNDVSAVARALTQFGADGRAGPVAMVVGISPLSLDMAVLLKQNVEPSRPSGCSRDCMKRSNG